MAHTNRSCGLPHFDLAAALKNGGLACSFVRVYSALQGSKGSSRSPFSPRYTAAHCPGRPVYGWDLHPYIWRCLFLLPFGRLFGLDIAFLVIFECALTKGNISFVVDIVSGNQGPHPAGRLEQSGPYTGGISTRTVPVACFAPSREAFRPRYHLHCHLRVRHYKG